jgi:hypothetical protein
MMSLDVEYKQLLSLKPNSADDNERNMADLLCRLQLSEERNKKVAERDVQLEQTIKVLRHQLVNGGMKIEHFDALCLASEMQVKCKRLEDMQANRGSACNSLAVMPVLPKRSSSITSSGMITLQRMKEFSELSDDAGKLQSETLHRDEYLKLEKALLEATVERDQLLNDLESLKCTLESEQKMKGTLEIEYKQVVGALKHEIATLMEVTKETEQQRTAVSIERNNLFSRI